MAEPIARRVIRYVCPFCSRGHSAKGRAAEHIDRCWWNPAVRACKTCTYFMPASSDCEPGCGCGSPDECGHPVGPTLSGVVRAGCPLWSA